MTEWTRKVLPYVTAKSPGILGKMRQAPEDFAVEEIPAYAPCGSGGHLFVRFEKIGLTTPEAVSALARALQVPPTCAAYAGLKDRQAVTRQWASFGGADPTLAARVDLPNIRILDIRLHTHKLKPGHLKGNRFEIRVRKPSGTLANARELLAELARSGCPNYYGEQRFGRHGDNAEVALAFVTGKERPPRDRFRRRFLFSAFQSALFNRWLAERVSRGDLTRAIEGDLMRREDSGGLFTSEDMDDLQARVAQYEISATGPMFGSGMRWPLGRARVIEEALLGQLGVNEAMLAAQRKLGSGTRRPCRVRPREWHIEPCRGDLLLRFTLPKGAYATTIMREIMKDDAVPDHPVDAQTDPRTDCS